jgi:hypothetical protein
MIRYLLPAVLFATGCVSATPQRDEKRSFVGKIAFVGEFHLFLTPDDPARSTECISGVFPIDQHLRVQKEYHNKYVRVTGTLVPYSSLEDEIGNERGWRGSQLPNYCGNDFVLLATEVLPAR